MCLAAAPFQSFKRARDSNTAKFGLAVNAPIFQLSKAPLVSPFSAGVFQEDPSKPATRLNLDLTLDAETESVLRQLDDFFEKKLQETAPGKSYHRLVQQTGDYPVRMHCKAHNWARGGANLVSRRNTPGQN